MIKKLDIKEVVIDKIGVLVRQKYSLLKTSKIWFETPIGEITSILLREGNNVFVKSTGDRIFPRAVKGGDLMKVIDSLNKNQIFSYIETGGQMLIVRPKNRISEAK